eukprot:gene12090-biopygen9878
MLTGCAAAQRVDRVGGGEGLVRGGPAAVQLHRRPPRDHGPPHADGVGDDGRRRRRRRRPDRPLPEWDRARRAGRRRGIPDRRRFSQIQCPMADLQCRNEFISRKEIPKKPQTLVGGKRFDVAVFSTVQAVWGTSPLQPIPDAV